MTIWTPGQVLAHARKRARLNQYEVAAHLGVSPSTISNYEHDRNLPALRYMKKLEELLKLTPWEVSVITDARLRRSDHARTNLGYEIDQYQHHPISGQTLEALVAIHNRMGRLTLSTVIGLLVDSLRSEQPE